MRSVRRWALLTAVVVVLVCAGVLALALTPTPASAFQNWAHNGAMGCSCHEQGTPTNATCEACHAGFQSYPDDTVLVVSCAGQDTSAALHAQRGLQPGMPPAGIPCRSSTSPRPHTAPTRISGPARSASPATPTSVGIADPGSSPHHSGQATGFSSCGTCHSSPQKHAGKVACASCHTDAQAFHLYEASSPGFKKCGACHTMRHAGVKVAASKCASVTRAAPGRAGAALQQRHQEVRLQRLPHQEAARQRGQQVRSRTAAPATAASTTRAAHATGKSTCTGCHSVAERHDNGFQCTLCHRRAVHTQRPAPAI